MPTVLIEQAGEPIVFATNGIEQIRIGYDANNYFSMMVDPSGVVTFEDCDGSFIFD